MTPAPVASMLALAVALCSGCGSTPMTRTSPRPSGPAASAYCLTSSDRPRAVQFDDINGQLVGSGDIGLVLTNGSSNAPCIWSGLLPSLLSTPRYLVLLYFYGSDKDVAAAGAFMLKQGVRRVLLLGESIGGARTLVAASHIQPPPGAAVSFSGESSPDEVGSLQIPTLIFASEDDRYFPGKTARQVAAAIPAADKALRVYPGQAHSLDILTGPNGAQALAVLLDFLARH